MQPWRLHVVCASLLQVQEQGRIAALNIQQQGARAADAEKGTEGFSFNPSVPFYFLSKLLRVGVPTLFHIA